MHDLNNIFKQIYRLKLRCHNYIIYQLNILFDTCKLFIDVYNTKTGTEIKATFIRNIHNSTIVQIIQHVTHISFKVHIIQVLYTQLTPVEIMSYRDHGGKSAVSSSCSLSPCVLFQAPAVWVPVFCLPMGRLKSRMCLSGGCIM